MLMGLCLLFYTYLTLQKTNRTSSRTDSKRLFCWADSKIELAFGSKTDSELLHLELFTSLAVTCLHKEGIITKSSTVFEKSYNSNSRNDYIDRLFVRKAPEIYISLLLKNVFCWFASKKEKILYYL